MRQLRIEKVVLIVRSRIPQGLIILLFDHLLQWCMSHFKIIQQFKLPISRLQGFNVKRLIKYWNFTVCTGAVSNIVFRRTKSPVTTDLNISISNVISMIIIQFRQVTHVVAHPCMCSYKTFHIKCIQLCHVWFCCDYTSVLWYPRDVFTGILQGCFIGIGTNRMVAPVCVSTPKGHGYDKSLYYHNNHNSTS